jgi:hypothetical protein
MTMKMLATTATLAAMIAWPASAQTVQQAPGVRQAPVPDQTFGQARPRPRAIIVIETDGRSVNPANDVYLGGRYMGSDPDPAVRFELRRDIPIGD